MTWKKEALAAGTEQGPEFDSSGLYSIYPRISSTKFDSGGMDCGHGRAIVLTEDTEDSEDTKDTDATDVPDAADDADDTEDVDDTDDTVVTDVTNATDHTDAADETDVPENTDSTDEKDDCDITEDDKEDFSDKNFSRKVFDFARVLKGTPDYCEADPKTLRLQVRQWFDGNSALLGSRDFFEVFAAFVLAWSKVKFSTSDEPMNAIAELLKTGKIAPPATVVESWPDPDAAPIRLLAGICRELQQLHGSAPFFLSCRKAGELLGVSHECANTFLNILVMDGLLKIALKGKSGKGHKATRFFWIGGL